MRKVLSMAEKTFYPSKGVINYFNKEKGYGFISCDNEEYFFHISNVNNAFFKEIRKGLKVGFMFTKASPKGLEAKAIDIL